MKIIPIAFISALLAIALIDPSSAWSKTIVSKESISNDVRRVVLLDDNGNKTSQFQICDKETKEWFEARLDESSKQWVLTAKGKRERDARIVYHRSEQRRFERQFNRSQ